MDGKLPDDFPGPVNWDDLPLALIITDEDGLVKGWNACAEHERDQLKAGYVNFTIPMEKGGFRGYLKLYLKKEEDERHAAMAIAADVAHEIRNPLGSIELFASLLRKTLTKEGDLRRVERIIEAVRLINERITGLLDMMRKKAIRREVFSLRDMITEIIGPQELRESFLRFAFSSEDIKVKGDERLLRHLFISMVVALLSRIPMEARLDISAQVRKEGDKCYGEVVFQVTCAGERMALKEILPDLNLPVYHHLVHLHDGMIKLDAMSIVVSLPVENE